jgi:hypothetical protein
MIGQISEELVWSPYLEDRLLDLKSVLARLARTTATARPAGAPPVA